MNINRCLIRVQQGERELTTPENAFTLSSSLWEYSRELNFVRVTISCRDTAAFVIHFMSTQVSRHGVLHFYFHFHDCRQYSFLRLRLKLSRAVPPFILLHQMPSSPDALLFKRSNLLLYQKFSFSPFLSLNFDSKHRLSCKRYT